MTDQQRTSLAPLMLSLAAICLAAAALTMTLINSSQDQRREAAIAEAFTTALMPGIEDNFREIYKDFGVEFPEGATTLQEMGAPLSKMIEMMQEETP